jgi:hypothetical protein
MERDFDKDMMKAVEKGDVNEVAELLAARPELTDARNTVRISNNSIFNPCFSFPHSDQNFFCCWLEWIDGTATGC